VSSRYAAHDLKVLAEEVMRRLGADDEEAGILADALFEGQLRTARHSNQGFVRLSVYAQRLRAGGLTPRAQMRVVTDGPVTAVFDAGNGFGQVAGVRAMKLAIVKAQQTGVAAVAVRNSNHYGMSGYYALMAARAGCVGIAVTNASPEIPAAGGAEALIGTNPWAIAAPSAAGDPLVLDVSNSQAGGKNAFREAASRGERLPHGWALDKDGHPTEDPHAGLEGIVAPLGGYKGVAIAIMMDVLAGALTGARLGAAVGSPYAVESPQGVGHLMVAIDIQRFMPLDEFARRVEQLSHEVASGRRAVGVDRLYLPGEPELERRSERLRNGCELLPDVDARLRSLAADLGLTFPQQLASGSA
jgi:LDH2 family malate/lactate/ureidoglycolate dehydrogenase